jgi:serine/threonine-protein kinase RsbW
MSTSDVSRLVLRNQLAELRRLAAWIERWTQEGVPANVSFALQLCLEEAVANVIMYGQIDGEFKIAIELERLGGALIARIEDDGQPFDPTRVAPHPLPSTLKEAKVGNLGIHLVRRFASRVDYERRHGRNRLTLRFEEKMGLPP